MIMLGVFAVVFVLWFPSVAIADNQIDLWYNFGLFFNYPEAIRWFSNSRQVSRVPVVLPGYVFTHLWGMIVSSYIMFFGYYITTAGFFYCAVRRFITRKVAFFSVIFLATSTFLIGAYSTTLADGQAVVYDAMCLYFIAVAMTSTKRTKARLALLASGFSAGLAVHCHLVIVPYLAANLVIYATWQLFLAPGQDPSKRVTDFVLGSLLVLLGILAVARDPRSNYRTCLSRELFSILNDFAYVPIAERNLAQYHNADWYASGAEAGMLLTACLIATLNIFAMRVGAGSYRPRTRQPNLGNLRRGPCSQRRIAHRQSARRCLSAVLLLFHMFRTVSCDAYFFTSAL